MKNILSKVLDPKSNPSLTSILCALAGIVGLGLVIYSSFVNNTLMSSNGMWMFGISLTGKVAQHKFSRSLTSSSYDIGDAG